MLVRLGWGATLDSNQDSLNCSILSLCSRVHACNHRRLSLPLAQIRRIGLEPSIVLHQRGRKGVLLPQPRGLASRLLDQPADRANGRRTVLDPSSACLMGRRHCRRPALEHAVVIAAAAASRAGRCGVGGRPLPVQVAQQVHLLSTRPLWLSGVIFRTASELFPLRPLPPHRRRRGHRPRHIRAHLLRALPHRPAARQVHPGRQHRPPALHRVLAPAERLGEVGVGGLRRARDLVVLLARPFAAVVGWRRREGRCCGGGGWGDDGGGVGHFGGCVCVWPMSKGPDG